MEAWTRDVPFLLRQEGRPVTDLVGNISTDRVMIKDWETVDKATQWIRHSAASLSQPFALYVGLNLPHPYQTQSLGPTAGGSTFRTSPYWLQKVISLAFHIYFSNENADSRLSRLVEIYSVSLLMQVMYDLISLPKWLPLSSMHPVDYYSTYTKNCTGNFTTEEVRSIRAFYYAMCAETDAMLGLL